MQIRRTTTVQNTNPIQLRTQNRTDGISTSTQNTIPVDQLDISAEAQALHAASNEIRADRVAVVREQIATGQYETAAKLEAAVDRILDEIA